MMRSDPQPHLKKKNRLLPPLPHPAVLRPVGRVAQRRRGVGVLLAGHGCRDGGSRPRPGARQRIRKEVPRGSELITPVSSSRWAGRPREGFDEFEEGGCREGRVPASDTAPQRIRKRSAQGAVLSGYGPGGVSTKGQWTNSKKALAAGTAVPCLGQGPAANSKKKCPRGRELVFTAPAACRDQGRMNERTNSKALAAGTAGPGRAKARDNRREATRAGRRIGRRDQGSKKWLRLPKVAGQPGKGGGVQIGPPLPGGARRSAAFTRPQWKIARGDEKPGRRIAGDEGGGLG